MNTGRTQFKKGHNGYWKGRKHPMSKSTIEKIGNALRGKKRKPHTEEWKNQMKKRMKGNSYGRMLKGEKSYLWKGGITPINQKIRTSFENKCWRKAVFERDNYTCIWCGDNHGGNLEADHIIPLYLILEKLKFEQGIDNLYEKALRYPLLLDIGNGRTLCKTCHKKTETYGSRESKKP